MRQVSVVTSKVWMVDTYQSGIAMQTLNTLLQSCGAIICKTWYVFIADAIKKAGLDATIVAFVHDEVQLVVKEGQEDETGRLIQQCMRDVQRHFGFRCKLDSEYKFGRSWADTH